jgi:N-acetylmuramoyl-L-alanine amidase
MPWDEAAAGKFAGLTANSGDQKLREGARTTYLPPREICMQLTPVFVHKTRVFGTFLRAFSLLFCVGLAAFSPAQQAPAIPTAPLPRPLPAAPMPSVQPRFSVVLDAAHGGSDTGARLSDKLLEKDIVLALSVRLRSLLTARGIAVTTIRESDASISPISRGETANHAAAAACISLHATATGSGIHLFTSSLTPTPATKFMPWQSAQSGYITQSLRLSSEINSAMAHAQVPVSLGRTSMQPLDSFACPAVAVEIAPLVKRGEDTAELSDSAYQAHIIEALAAAIQQWREDWRQQP